MKNSNATLTFNKSIDINHRLFKITVPGILKTIMLFGALFYSGELLAQTGNVGIGTINPEPSAILDLTATDKGILIPRIADTTLVPAPATGLLIYHTADDAFYYFDGIWWRPFGFGGPAGPAGANGTNGIDGVTGSTGPTGLTGAMGPIGIQGPAGLDGVDGANGVNGAQGPTGAQGPAGINGMNGAQGPTGPQGPAGANGTNGTNGAQGPQGPTGIITSSSCDCPMMISTESPMLNYSGALTYCESLVESGYSDWYLPSLEVLLKLSSGVAIIPDARTNNYLWTTTLGINGANFIKVARIGTNAGIYEWIPGLQYARCVR